MSNKVRQNLGISHGPYIDISLSKRGSGVGKFYLVFIFTTPHPHLHSLAKNEDWTLNLFSINDLWILACVACHRFVAKIVGDLVNLDCFRSITLRHAKYFLDTFNYL